MWDSLLRKLVKALDSSKMLPLSVWILCIYCKIVWNGVGIINNKHHYAILALILSWIKVQIITGHVTFKKAAILYGKKDFQMNANSLTPIYFNSPSMYIKFLACTGDPLIVRFLGTRNKNVLMEIRTIWYKLVNWEFMKSKDHFFHKT